MEERFENKLRRLKDEFSDEIPNQWVDSNSPNKFFKVRGNWFQGLIAILENGIMKGEITDPALIRKVERGINRFTQREFTRAKPTKPREIKYANLLIKLVLGEK